MTGVGRGIRRDHGLYRVEVDVEEHDAEAADGLDGRQRHRGRQPAGAGQGQRGQREGDQCGTHGEGGPGADPAGQPGRGQGPEHPAEGADAQCQADGAGGQAQEAVDRERDRGGRGLHQGTPDGRARHERHRPGGAEQRVGLDVLVAPHQGDEERLPGRLVERRPGPEQHGDDDELGVGQHPQQVGHRHGEHDDRLQQVCQHQHPTASPLPVDPAAEHEREQVRQPDRGGEQADLGGRGADDRHGGRWQCEAR
jgi:hypothetical protein